VSNKEVSFLQGHGGELCFSRAAEGIFSWIIINARYLFATGFKTWDPEPENEIYERKRLTEYNRIL